MHKTRAYPFAGSCQHDKTRAFYSPADWQPQKPGPPENLKKYLTEDVIEDYEECILSGNDGCDTYWYIDKNYTQWKIENGIISYLDKKPLKWVNIKNKDSEN